MRSEKVAEMVKNERATEKQIERFAFLLQKVVSGDAKLGVGRQRVGVKSFLMPFSTLP